MERFVEVVTLYSFTLVITNIAILLGTLRLIVWIDTHIGEEHRLGIFFKLVLESLCILCHVSISVLQRRVFPDALDFSPIYLGMILAVLFIFNLIVRSHWQILFNYGTVFALYVISGIVLNFWDVVGILGIGTLGTVLQRYRKVFFANRWVFYGFATVYTLLGLFNLPRIFAHVGFSRDIAFLAVFVLLLEIAIFYEFFRLTLQHVEYLRQLEEHATTDRLTNLKNFGECNRHMQRLFQRYKENGQRYALCEFDIDYFKSVNDKYGHLVGNEVLREVASELRAFALEQPYTLQAYRLGGEEFCLVIEDPEAYMALDYSLTATLQERISALRFGTGPGAFSVTISVGLTIVQPEDANFLDVYKRVDRVLYQAKQEGRNRVIVLTEEA